MFDKLHFKIKLMFEQKLHILNVQVNDLQNVVIQLFDNAFL